MSKNPSIVVSEVLRALNLSEHESELAESRAIMLYNYGSEGKCIKYLISEHDKLAQMIIKVFEYYETKIKKG